MNFLRTLGWIALTIVIVVFSLRNWAPVTVNLFAGLQADVKLPLLLLIAFLLGFLPLYAYHRAVRWTLKKKLHNSRKLGIDPIVDPMPYPAAPTPHPPLPMPMPTPVVTPFAPTNAEPF